MKVILYIHYLTLGIGDGGNELGMGKVKEAVKKYIKNGDVIACDVEADFAVVAGKTWTDSLYENGTLVLDINFLLLNLSDLLTPFSLLKKRRLLHASIRCDL